MDCVQCLVSRYFIIRMLKIISILYHTQRYQNTKENTGKILDL